ncbi:MAG: hypothetical protein ACOYL6_15425 [Bacteriovoracaceae bacterium]
MKILLMVSLIYSQAAFSGWCDNWVTKWLGPKEDPAPSIFVENFTPAALAEKKLSPLYSDPLIKSLFDRETLIGDNFFLNIRTNRYRVMTQNIETYSLFAMDRYGGGFYEVDIDKLGELQHLIKTEEGFVAIVTQNVKPKTNVIGYSVSIKGLEANILYLKRGGYELKTLQFVSPAEAENYSQTPQLLFQMNEGSSQLIITNPLSKESVGVSFPKPLITQ